MRVSYNHYRQSWQGGPQRCSIRRFKATQLAFDDVGVNDGILNVAALQHDGKTTPGKCLANRHGGSSVTGGGGHCPVHIVSVHPVANAFRIGVAPGANLAAYLSRLTDLELHESTDLEEWTNTGISPTVADDRLLFQPLPDRPKPFYRVAASAANEL